MRTAWRISAALLTLGLAAAAQSSSAWKNGCAGAAAATTGNVTWTPSLCQEFNGALAPADAQAFSFDLGNGGFGNQEIETYCGPPGYAGNPAGCPASFDPSTSNAYLDGAGHLVIQVLHNLADGNWYSARLKTQNVQAFGYGRIEASIELPDTTNPGLWPAFWWLGTDIASVSWPDCGEADIMEDWSPQVYNGPGVFGNRATLHTAQNNGDGSGLNGAYTFPNGEQANTAFYAYGVIWSANLLQFYVAPAGAPGTSIRPFLILTPSDMQSPSLWPFNVSGGSGTVFLLANVAVGGVLGGSTANTASPDKMLIDYIREYSASSVPAPSLGQPPAISITAGAASGNSSTFTPAPAPGTGYVYFSCDTDAPKASCSIQTNDPLNHYVVNSDANPAETVTVTVNTTSNAGLPAPPPARPPAAALWAIGLAAALALAVFRRARRRPRLAAIGLAGIALSAIILLACGGGGNVMPPASGNNFNGTTPGTYTVNVYAFTEANTGSGANATADAKASLQLKVN